MSETTTTKKTTKVDKVDVKGIAKLSVLQERVPSLFKGTKANAGAMTLSYANLPAVMEKVNEAMKDLGLYSIVNFEPIDGVKPMEVINGVNQYGKPKTTYLVTGIYKLTIVDAETQERETFSTIASADMNDSSATSGSVMTYFDRYLWSKVLRVAFSTEKDVEEKVTNEHLGEQVQQQQAPQQAPQQSVHTQQVPPQQEPQPQPQAPVASTISIEDRAKYLNLIATTFNPNQIDGINKHYNVTSYTELASEVLKEFLLNNGIIKDGE